MSGMEKISEAILDKARADAQNMIQEAETKAREKMEKAKKQQKEKVKEEKNRLIEEAKGEAARILAQASISSGQQLLAAKTKIIGEITSRVEEALAGFSGDESSLLNLIKETVNTLDSGKVRVYVSPKNIATVRKLLKADKKLAVRVTEVKEFDCSGGVIAEDIDGRLRVDNTYETRLEMLLPQLLPEISEELFHGL